NLRLKAPVDDPMDAAKTIRRDLVELSTIDLLKSDVVPIKRVRAIGTPAPAIKREQSPVATIMGVAAFPAADTIADQAKIAPQVKVVVDRALASTPEPVAPSPSHAPESPWKNFEDIGLVPRPFTKKAQKLVVSSYRLLGFGILSLIVFVLLAYIATTAF